MQSFVCEICISSYPVSLLNEHHKIPQALGGSDDPANIAQLCSGCHQSLHSVAFMIKNPKRRHEVDPTIISLFPQDAEARARIRRFASLVAREMLLKKEVRKAPREELKIMVQLPSRYLELLKQAGMDMPSRTGRRAGVAKVLRQVVADYLMRKFPAHRSEVLDMFTPLQKPPQTGRTPDPDEADPTFEEADGFELQSDE